MHVKTQKLLDFLEADKKTFSIPLFQRPYSWKQWQCEVLWNDIVRISKTDVPHFFGALFYKKAYDKKACGDGDYTLSLIDGQQRTLTSLLLLSAFVDRLEEDGLADNADNEGKNGLDAGNIKDTYLRSEAGAKVHPSKRDEESFSLALNIYGDKADGKTSVSNGFGNTENAAADNADSEGIASESASLEGADSKSTAAENTSPDSKISNAIANKTFFSEKMSDDDFDPEVFWRGLGNLEVVSVELEDTDDAQSIFESFNSKGVPLVAADMVRNYLLLAESPEDQERLYYSYWEPIQGLFGDDPGSLRLNNAMRAWTVIRCKTPKAKADAECFDDFKQYFLNEYDGGNEDLMEELLGFCSIWAENYRYHAVKKFRSANWAKIGCKTLVSDRKLAPASQASREFYAKHYDIELKN